MEWLQVVSSALAPALPSLTVLEGEIVPAPPASLTFVAELEGDPFAFRARPFPRRKTIDVRDCKLRTG